ncbi:unnamed protein product, partial [marine sediment metagenome]
MAWFQKQSKLRRISEERWRPVPQKPSAPLTPPGKRAGRFLMTLLFLAGGLVIINFPRSAPRLKVGDIAERDYRARVQFEMPDMESTLRARRDAQARCPRLFVENAAHLERIPDELEKFLTTLLEASRATRLAREGRTWGIPPKRLSRLKQGLDKKWVQEAVEVVRPALARAGDLGIMDGSKFQQEMAAGRYDIVVHKRESPDQEDTRPLGLTIEYPGDLREFFEDELR